MDVGKMEKKVKEKVNITHAPGEGKCGYNQCEMYYSCYTQDFYLRQVAKSSKSSAELPEDLINILTRRHFPVFAVYWKTSRQKCGC